MIALYENQPVSARVRLTDDDYLRTRYYLHPDGTADITVGRGRDWTVLACKECYGKAVKTVLDLEPDSCVFDLSPAARLGQPGLNAALEGILGGSHRKADCLTDVRCPALTCYASGSGFTLPQLTAAWQLAEDIMAVRNYVNLPANLLTPMDFAARLTALAQGLPIETAVYDRQQLEDLGLRGLLTVGGSSGHPPALVVLRYTGAPEDPRRVGFVGKGVTVDSGGYCLKSASSMAGIKGDMAGGAAAAAALHALARHGVRVNVTAVIPTCENRISPHQHAPRGPDHPLFRPDRGDPQRRCRGPPDPGRRPHLGHPPGGLHPPGGYRHPHGSRVRHAGLCDHRRHGLRRRLVRLPDPGRRALR